MDDCRNMADLWYLGLTHRCCSSDVRDRFALPGEELQPLLLRLSDLAHERFILSTCERFEIYALTRDRCPTPWIRSLSKWFDVPEATLARHVDIKRGQDVARHLIRVSAGLDSRILFEPQVLRQIRGAQAIADDVDCLGPILHALVRAAICAGKRVRRDQPGDSDRLSIVNIALDRVAAIGVADSPRNLCVVGTGALAREFLSACAHRFERITVASRCPQRGRLLAANFGGQGIAMTSLVRVLADADVLVTCTTSRTPLIRPDMLNQRRTNLLRIVDLGVPRNVDPRVGALPDVSLTHLDDLVTAAPGAGSALLAEAIVQEEADRFTKWHRGRVVAPLVAELFQHHLASCGAGARAQNRLLHERILQIKASVAA